MEEMTYKHRKIMDDLRQHFHNYFELLLDAERGKLLRSIAKLTSQSDYEPLLVEIDHRINYLRGAVKMGTLLCLINQEEAQANYRTLLSERDRLNANALGLSANPEAKSKSSHARFELIRKSIQQVVRP